MGIKVTFITAALYQIFLRLKRDSWRNSEVLEEFFN